MAGELQHVREGQAFKPSAGDHNAIIDAARIVKQQQAIGTVGLLPINRTSWYWAKATSSISIGTLAVPTTFTFNIWLPDPSSGADPVPFIVATESALLGLTGTNRSSMSGSSGAMCKVEFAFGEWSLKWLDC